MHTSCILIIIIETLITNAQNISITFDSTFDDDVYQNATIRIYEDYNDYLQNERVKIISIILGILSTLTLTITSFIIIYQFAVYCFKKFLNKFISNKPYSFIFWYSWIADLLIISIMYWWTIKAAIFYTIQYKYCSINYPSKYDDEACLNDEYCDINDNDECYMKNDKDVQQNDILWLFFLWFLMWAGHIIYNLCWCFWKNDCCLLCLYYTDCCDGHKDIGDAENRQKRWQHREIWMDATNECYNECVHIFDFFPRYAVFILFASIYKFYYGEIEEIGDYGIEIYAFCPMIILLIFKYGLQFYYKSGPEYYPEIEVEIENHIKEIEILRNYFGDDLTEIIKWYLPFYHDIEKCPKYLQIKQRYLDQDDDDDDDDDINNNIKCKHIEGHKYIELYINDD